MCTCECVREKLEYFISSKYKIKKKIENRLKKKPFANKLILEQNSNYKF